MKTKNFSYKMLSIEPPDLRSQVQHAPLYTNLAFACKTETLNSLYSHTLLILTKSSKSKHQVVHEQKFKDLLSSTCQECREEHVGLGIRGPVVQYSLG